MSYHPILFSALMVRAILDGSKTMTRRVMKIQPPDASYQLAQCMSTTGRKRDEGRLHWLKCEGVRVIDGAGAYFDCPYGHPGDRLWVRETFVPHLCFGLDEEIIHYRADSESCSIDGTTLKRWKPSIFMPRWASRITLEVVSVRVERVQDITHEDAIREGCKPHPLQDSQTVNGDFETLWDSINAKRGLGWSQNPWVWVVEFRRITP